ncbi:hypothetical protein [Variovorax paradoxus]|jgi:hypothetical protein|uniref:hypothetical protein n=1 Tax=Variovorax paradoxus TaxID=34073 RepID=UPI00247FBE43|nr:hypothetical protein [Variovorax paradoxus]WGT62614.1 hypothetical protein QHG62_21595 [Variovorax paradoxus]
MAIFRGSKTWLALLVVPAFALLYQTLAYAAVPGACDLQNVLLLHALSVAALLGCLVPTLLSAHEWHRLGSMPRSEHSLDSDAAVPAARRRFMAAAATGVGALFTLVVASQWFAAWVLSPCLH